MARATTDDAAARARARSWASTARAVRRRVREATRRARRGTMRVERSRARASGYAAGLDVVYASLGGLDGAKRGLRVVLIYGEHGRELVPVDAGLRFLDALADGEDAVVALARGIEGGDERRLRETLRATTFAIAPMENERGRAIVEGGNACERKNGRGVDPNRNWGVDWGVKAPDYDPKEEFPGTEPFSEPESRMLRDLVKSFRPHAVVNWHSGMSAIFMPYDHVAREPTGPGAEAMMRFAHVIDAEHCDKKCTLGSGGKGVGYLAHGTATDYIYEKMKVPVVYTWEIYGDVDAPYEECYRAFNPLTKEAYERVVNDWVGAPVTLVSMLETHPDVSLDSLNLADEFDAPGALFKFSTALLFAFVGIVVTLALRRRRARRASSSSRLAPLSAV